MIGSAYAETSARVKMAKNDIIYTRAETVDKLMAQADRHNAQTVCVDYISLMQSQRRAAADWERVKDISSSLKQMALGMGVRVYAAAQSGRPRRSTGRPRTTSPTAIDLLGLQRDDRLAPDARDGAGGQDARSLDQEPLR
jgi:replicative DNA helicase